MPLRVFFLRVCKRLCQRASRSTDRVDICAVCLDPFIKQAIKCAVRFNVDRFFDRKLHSSVQIYRLLQFHIAILLSVRLPRKGWNYRASRYRSSSGELALQAPKETNSCLITGDRFWPGKFHEAFRIMLWTKWQPLWKKALRTEKYKCYMNIFNICYLLLFGRRYSDSIQKDKGPQVGG